MSWTKRELITAAFEAINMADYLFDLTPEQLQSACLKMDALIASWTAVNISYASSDSPSTADIDVDSGLPAYCNAAVYMNLAISLASTIGKNVSLTLMGEAKKAYLAMLSASMPETIEYQMPSSLPRGAGQKSIERPFVNPLADLLQTGPEGDFEFNN